MNVNAKLENTKLETYQILNENKILESGENLETEEKNEISKEVNNLEEDTINIENPLWIIEIPKIGLKAEITEGTSAEILDSYVGHFEETQKNIGNIGLAAHNRGYKVNYFEHIKDLEIGDEIIYTYGNIVRKYKVSEKKKIKDTEWESLENTEDNRLTLITCVENEPEYRRCIQATEV